MGNHILQIAIIGMQSLAAEQGRTPQRNPGTATATAQGDALLSALCPLACWCVLSHVLSFGLGRVWAESRMMAGTQGVYHSVYIRVFTVSLLVLGRICIVSIQYALSILFSTFDYHLVTILMARICMILNKTLAYEYMGRNRS
jgi:hypothetical protein